MKHILFSFISVAALSTAVQASDSGYATVYDENKPGISYRVNMRDLAQFQENIAPTRFSNPFFKRRRK